MNAVDYVPNTLPPSSGLGLLVILEDDEPVIKICIKQRCPQCRHVPRTHRINLDWLIERISTDPGIRLKYINTKRQAADILTKGVFTAAQFEVLVMLCQNGARH